ncbi:hypothetical protein ACS0TY_015890 [Phlomoides rotata]
MNPHAPMEAAASDSRGINLIVDLNAHTRDNGCSFPRERVVPYVIPSTVGPLTLGQATLEIDLNISVGSDSLGLENNGSHNSKAGTSTTRKTSKSSQAQKWRKIPLRMKKKLEKSEWNSFVSDLKESNTSETAKRMWEFGKKLGLKEPNSEGSVSAALPAII